MTDAEILEIIADGIVDGTDMDCTTADQARAVLKALREAGVLPPSRKRQAPKMQGNEPFTAQELSDRMDAICGCNGEWDCDCVSVVNKAFRSLWTDYNERLAQ
jgi:hypothetical protein